MKINLLLILLILARSVSGQGFEKDLSGKPVVDSMQQAINAISSKSIDEINKKYKKLGNSIQNKSLQLLQNMQNEELKIKKKLVGTDSNTLNILFEGSKEKYQSIQSKMEGIVNGKKIKLKEYIPGLDSVGTAFGFLKMSSLQMPSLEKDKIQQITDASAQIKNLQDKLQQANELQTFIVERQQALKSALANSGISKNLINLNKQVYYYQQQIVAYKNMLHEPEKMERKALEILNKIPAFQKFMQKNSMIASLLRLPTDYGSVGSLEGMQTRAQVEAMISERFAGVGANSQQFFEQNVQTAQSALTNLKDKVRSSGGSSSEMTMPDFKPNSQKIKPFLKRLETGFNLQSQKSSGYFPSSTDLALSIGYKLTEARIIGIALSYKIGLGKGFNDIHFTSEGLGLRSFVDIRAKGTFWITGGWEYNYLQRIKDITVLKDSKTWQKSALIGVSKKYKISSKYGGSVQLLYDFYANRQLPTTSPIKFRIGYTL
ncbi:ring-infected erythrocyte surface antigen domain-containing protein [Limnovirga soli]|uniref:Uncharacterized protein n=1 Tax=Limnovirga soli TaxID=2656915 RepID=A0A8J8F9G8_9BACT|nr:hypothetical protein [Limnovirga soli]NNV53863.1 hypothetical protein [Limnovirga soli]